jgi:translation initiation factor 2B subunit (eIF-2B alpha/beta/delta family)
VLLMQKVSGVIISLMKSSSICLLIGDYTEQANHRQRNRRLILREKENPAEQRIFAAIIAIRDDKKSGAAEMLARSAEVFSLLADSQTKMNSLDLEAARSRVFGICLQLALAQPYMAPLANLANEVSAAASLASNARDVFEQACEAARSFLDRARRAVRLAVSNAASEIYDGATILTHSRSSTTLAALLEARRAGKKFSVIATESRPGLEGRKLAEELRREVASVTLIADAAAALVMGQIDFVLLGADRVTPEFLINKIGTRMIALAARELSAPVYAVCDTSKFASTAKASEPATSEPTAAESAESEPTAAESEPSREDRSGEELWPDAPAGISILNRYFEPAPLGLFASIFTEDGALTPAQASSRAAAMSIREPLPGLSGKPE